MIKERLISIALTQLIFYFYMRRSIISVYEANNTLVLDIKTSLLADNLEAVFKLVVCTNRKSIILNVGVLNWEGWC